MIEHLRAQSASRSQQARRLATLAQGDASRADALETTLIHILTRLQPAATRFCFPHHNLTSRRSQSVAIDDDSALPAEWLTVKTTTSPDKTAIKAALKAGHTAAVQIEGAGGEKSCCRRFSATPAALPLLLRQGLNPRLVWALSTALRINRATRCRPTWRPAALSS